MDERTMRPFWSRFLRGLGGRRLLVWLAAWSCTACSKPMSEADARRILAEHQGLVDRIHADLVQTIDRTSRFGPQAPDAAARTAESLAGDRAALGATVDRLAAQPDVRGLVLSVVARPGGAVEELARGGLHPRADANDAVHAGDGAAVDGRALGWGRFQVPGSSSDYAPGIELRWTIDRPPAVLTVDVAIVGGTRD